MTLETRLSPLVYADNTVLPTKLLDPVTNLLMNGARLSEFLLPFPLELRWVWEVPVKPKRRPGEYWTSFCTCLVTYGDHERKNPSAPDNVPDVDRCLTRYVYPLFLQYFYYQWVQNPWLKTGALNFESIPTFKTEDFLSHLASGTVVNAEKEDAWLSAKHVDRVKL